MSDPGDISAAQPDPPGEVPADLRAGGTDGADPPPSAATPAYAPRQRVWWAWPLRFSAQIFVVIWVWKFYGCMQLADCSDHSAQDRLLVHAIVAAMTAFAIELLLLVNRVFEEPG